jgi:hypothetical protein
LGVDAYAYQQDYRHFDFGRSLRGSGVFSFKKNFGFKAHPLNYQYQLISAKHISGAGPENIHLFLLQIDSVHWFQE